MNERLKKVCKTDTLIFLAGLGYAFLWFYTPIRIPCVFYAVTGWKCPGCGISHLFAALLQGKPKEAFFYNPAVFVLLPILALLLLRHEIRYVRTGDRRLTRSENRILWGMTCLLLLFGILRNL